MISSLLLFLNWIMKMKRRRRNHSFPEWYLLNAAIMWIWLPSSAKSNRCSNLFSIQKGFRRDSKWRLSIIANFWNSSQDRFNQLRINRIHRTITLFSFCRKRSTCWIQLKGITIFQWFNNPISTISTRYSNRRSFRIIRTRRSLIERKKATNIYTSANSIKKTLLRTIVKEWWWTLFWTRKWCWIAIY